MVNAGAIACSGLIHSVEGAGAFERVRDALSRFAGRELGGDEAVFESERATGNLRAFNADVPIFAQWDNHEVMEEWSPGATFSRPGYAENNTLLLAARGCRAFHEFMPMRFTPAEPGRIYRKISYGPLLDVFLLDMCSYRGPNGFRPQDRYGPDAYILGPQQLAWLKRELARSATTWKVIATDTPLSVIGAGASDAHTPLGRGIEIADLLSFMRRTGIRNTLWITADHCRPALHCRALFRSEPCGVSGLRAVLGIRVRPDPCRHLDAEYARPDLRPARRLLERMQPGAGREPPPPASACSSSARWRSTARPAC
jgi:hypothetical protein